MLILILLVLSFAGLTITKMMVFVPLGFLQALVPPMWLSVALALGLLAWLMRE